MGGRIAQEKWETERSNRKESIRSANREQDGYYREKDDKKNERESLWKKIKRIFQEA